MGERLNEIRKRIGAVYAPVDREWLEATVVGHIAELEQERDAALVRVMDLERILGNWQELLASVPHVAALTARAERAEAEVRRLTDWAARNNLGLPEVTRG